MQPEMITTDEVEQLPVEQTIEQLAQTVKSRLASLHIDTPLMIGIHTGGAWVAHRLQKLLGLTDPLGTLDISFYRDDFTHIGMHPQVKPSNLPAPVDDRHIILVDDVLHTGRTIRSALNEIFDYGRPASVTLVVLIERSGRELPIQADVVGKRITLQSDEHIKLTGPDPLKLTLTRAPKKKS